MTVEISERALEEAIERALLAGGPDAYAADAAVVLEVSPALP